MHHKMVAIKYKVILSIVLMYILMVNCKKPLKPNYGFINNGMSDIKGIIYSDTFIIRWISGQYYMVYPEITF